MIIAASNCPLDLKRELKHYIELSNIPLFQYPGTGVDLGTSCGKPFAISILTIREPGDSDILSFMVNNDG